MMENQIQIEGANGESADKQTSDQKYQRSNPNFEKNYPKNIFIPIIQYLNEVGLKREYEAVVGTREDLENKNVVSLAIFYQLLTQNWFQQYVDRENLEINICNKIFLNSKIKKKLFHLRVTSLLLNTEGLDPKQYKKFVSKNANSIASEISENDELFRYSSSSIYLLHLYSSCLEMILQAQKHKILVDFKNLPKMQKGDLLEDSKLEMKNLIKEVISLLSQISLNDQEINFYLEGIKNIILQRADKVRIKYGLSLSCPNWIDFYDCFVVKSFDWKRRGLKITNSSLKIWIKEYKELTMRIGINKNKENTFQLPVFTPIILIPPKIHHQLRT